MVLSLAEKAVDLFLRGEEADQQLGKVGLFAGSWKHDAKEAIEGFREESTIRRKAGLGKQWDSIGLFEDGGDARVVAIAQFGRRFQD